jgi:hypothetical protein
MQCRPSQRARSCDVVQECKPVSFLTAGWDSTLLHFSSNTAQSLNTWWLPIASLIASVDCPRDTIRLAFRQKELSLLTKPRPVPRIGSAHFPASEAVRALRTSLHRNYRRANDRQSVEAPQRPANSCRALSRDGRAGRGGPKITQKLDIDFNPSEKIMSCLDAEHLPQHMQLRRGYEDWEIS